MPASGDLIPAYLAGLLASNNEGAVGPNVPFQGFTAPSDTVALSDELILNPHGPSSVYGTRIYGGFFYGHP